MAKKQKGNSKLKYKYDKFFQFILTVALNYEKV